LAMTRPRVCVLGAGVVGLTTAVRIQEEVPGLQVTVLAERFSPITTSDVAAGIFHWGLQGPDKETTEKWARDSWEYYQGLLDMGRPWETGVSVLPIYHWSQYEQLNRPIMNELCPVYRDLTDKELDLASPQGKFRFGKYYHTMQIETSIYLSYLQSALHRTGVHLIQRKVSNLASLKEEFDLVINCSGLGSRSLCGDSSILPLRGQVLQVSAPWVKTGLYADDVYILPGQNYVTIGSTRQYNDWMSEESPHDSARIWSRAVSTFPCISGAKLLDTKVGLRPYRPQPRVELEVQEGTGLPVIHNYGHGGYGIMSSPATAHTVVSLVKDWIQARQIKKEWATAKL